MSTTAPEICSTFEVLRSTLNGLNEINELNRQNRLTDQLTNVELWTSNPVSEKIPLTMLPAECVFHKAKAIKAGLCVPE